MLFLIKDGGEADESPCVLRGVAASNRVTEKSEGKFCPHSFYLLSLAAAMPMSRAFQKSGEGSEGRFDNFLFLSRLLLNSTLFCTNLPLSMQF